MCQNTQFLHNKYFKNLLLYVIFIYTSFYVNVVILFTATGLTDNCTTSTKVHNNVLFSSLQIQQFNQQINNITFQQFIPISQV